MTEPKREYSPRMERKLAKCGISLEQLPAENARVRLQSRAFSQDLPSDRAYLTPESGIPFSYANVTLRKVDPRDIEIRD